MQEGVQYKPAGYNSPYICLYIRGFLVMGSEVLPPHLILCCSAMLCYACGACSPYAVTWVVPAK